MKIEFVEGAPAAIGPYAHAVRVGSLVFCSGQTPLDPVSMNLVGDNIEEQTLQALKNLETVLVGLDLSLKHIVKTNVYLATMEDFDGMNRVYAEVFGSHTPARTTIAVKQNPLNALVEIECIADAGSQDQNGIPG